MVWGEAMKILLVEDDFALAMGTEYALQAEGYEVVKAGNVEAARTAIDNDKPDLVLLDVMLPDGNGFEFLQHIKKTNENVFQPKNKSITSCINEPVSIVVIWKVSFSFNFNPYAM